jgi:hypothetical protein
MVNGWAVSKPDNLNKVSWIIVFSVATFKNCFGNSFLDRGHKREPVPPAIITGDIISISL